MNGVRNGMLSLDINAHGIPNGKPAEFYGELRRGRLAGYPHQGNQSRDTCYFRSMYLRLVRAIDFLAAQRLKGLWGIHVACVSTHANRPHPSPLPKGEGNNLTLSSPDSKFSLTYSQMRLNWSENSEGRLKHYEQRFSGNNGFHHGRDQGDV